MQKRKRKGFTLIEMVVVLAIIASLAAFLTPMVLDYIKEGRLRTAQNDVQQIASGITNFYRDLGTWPVHTAVPLRASNATLKILSTDGTAPSINSSLTWDVANSVATLKNSVHDGYVGTTTTNTYSGNVNTPYSWKGPYLSDFKADPWGNKYYVIVEGLQPTSSNTAYVISGGPNGQLDTTQFQTATGATIPGSGTDDIVFRFK